MKNIIYVNYLSRFANNIFQYALAHIIKDLVDGEIYFSPYCVLHSGKSHDQPAEEISILDTPIYQITDSTSILQKKEWSGKFREDEKEFLRKTGVHFAEDILKFENDTLKVSNDYRGEPIILSGYYQNHHYYKGKRTYIANLLHQLYCDPPENIPGKNDLILNFRGTDLSWAQMPLNYYRWILDREQFDKLWIVTEDPHHDIVSKLLDIYSGELFSNGTITDFKFVMSAKKIIMSVSTFCWMAAWLSEADKIYFPLGSRYDLFDRNNDKRLIIMDDPRYIYVKPFFSGVFLLKELPYFFHEVRFLR